MKYPLVIILLSTSLALAQSPPAPPAIPKPTVVQLQSQVAQDNVTIAQLRAQLDDMRFELQLYTASTGRSAQQEADRKSVDEAKRVAQVAAQAAEAAEVKPAKPAKP